jgi:hypothetical protein
MVQLNHDKAADVEQLRSELLDAAYRRLLRVVGYRLRERLVAELTDAAYRVALRHGLKGSFLDWELDLWRELQSVLTAEGDARS